MIYLLLISLIGYSHAEIGCAGEPSAENRPYLLQCAKAKECTCPKGSTSNLVNFHLSSPLENSIVVSCSSASLTPVTEINQINEFNHPNSLQSNDDDKLRCLPISERGVAEFIYSRTHNFKKGCRYDSRVNSSTINAFLDSILNPKKGPENTCIATMCTSASFAIFLLALRELQSKGRLPKEVNIEELCNTRSIGWKYFNEMARPDLAITELDLGRGMIINRSELTDCASKDWPAAGDFVQIWRSNNSGHSVVFSNYLRNAAGENIGICYWSSNSETKGLSHRCEALDKIQKIIVGRITK